MTASGRLLALVLVCVTGWLAGWFGYATVAVLPDLDQREIPWLMPTIGALLVAACLGVGVPLARWLSRTSPAEPASPWQGPRRPWVVLALAALAAVVYRFVTWRLALLPYR